MNTLKASSQAHSNIALSKYWGQRDQKRSLPFQSSVSMTLDKFFTQTTVEFDPALRQDQFWLDKTRQTSGGAWNEFSKFMDLIRKTAGIKLFAKVASRNNFPTAAGLASSASGFAALALAGSKAAGLDLTRRELSSLSRQGSGSASRSIEGGFVEFLRGKKSDGSDSYGRQIATQDHWPQLRMIVNIVTREKKKWGSREGMQASVHTSPYYPVWVKTAQTDAKKVKQGIRKKDFSGVGELAEFNCLKMHAVMMATRPPLIYWNPTTIEIMHRVLEWRSEGLESYFTMDAGPQVKVLCLQKDEHELLKRLAKIRGIEQSVVCRAGPDAKLLNRHLF